jgi:hypothetical protein
MAVEDGRVTPITRGARRLVLESFVVNRRPGVPGVKERK